MQTLSDRKYVTKLISGTIAGDKTEWGTLSRLTDAKLRPMLQRLKWWERDDVIQEFVLSLPQTLRSFRLGSNYESWLSGCARLLALNSRRKHMQLLIGLHGYWSQRRLSSQAQPSDIASQDEEASRLPIRGIKGLLTQLENDALVLRFNFDLSPDAIAKKLDLISTKSAERAIERGIVKLRRHLGA